MWITHSGESQLPYCEHTQAAQGRGPSSEELKTLVKATYLGGVGLQLTSSGTDYCIDDGWTETMLTEESFCALYKEFFMEELIGQHTCPTEDSVVLLQEIIQQLQEEK